MSNYEDYMRLRHPDEIGRAEYRAIWDLLSELYSDKDSAEEQPTIPEVLDEVQAAISIMKVRLGVKTVFRYALYDYTESCLIGDLYEDREDAEIDAVRFDNVVILRIAVSEER